MQIQIASTFSSFWRKKLFNFTNPQLLDIVYFHTSMTMTTLQIKKSGKKTYCFIIKYPQFFLISEISLFLFNKVFMAFL